MENTKRKVPVWAIILYTVTGLLLLAGVALIIFSAIDSATLLPYKRQNILEYFSDGTHYYTVAGTVEELSVGTLADGAYPLTLTLARGQSGKGKSVNQLFKAVYKYNSRPDKEGKIRRITSEIVLPAVRLEGGSF